MSTSTPAPPPRRSTRERRPRGGGGGDEDDMIERTPEGEGPQQQQQPPRATVHKRKSIKPFKTEEENVNTMGTMTTVVPVTQEQQQQQQQLPITIDPTKKTFHHELFGLNPTTTTTTVDISTITNAFAHFDATITTCSDNKNNLIPVMRKLSLTLDKVDILPTNISSDMAHTCALQTLMDVTSSNELRTECAILLLHLFTKSSRMEMRSDDTIQALIDYGRTLVATSNITALCGLLGFFAEVVICVPLDDGFVAQLESLVVQKCPLQVMCRGGIDVMCCMYEQYPTLQDVIMDDVFSILLTMHESTEEEISILVENFSAGGTRNDLRPHVLTLLITSLVQVGGDKCADVITTNWITRLGQCDECKDAGVLLKRVLKDLLQIIHAPEWGLAAETLLCSFSTQLCRMVTMDGDGADNNIVTLLALDGLSEILEACHLERMTLENGWVAPGAGTVAATTEGNDVIACPCGEGFGGRFMLDCSHCHRWFHGQCVGVSEMTPELNALTWTCDDCIVTNDVQDNDGLVMNYLVDCANKTKDRVLKRTYARATSSLTRPEKMVSGKKCLSRTGTASVLRAMQNQGDGFSSVTFHTILLRSMMRATRTSVHASHRARALKALASILQHDSSLMNDALFKTCVEERFGDEAVSVRESALDLVDRYGKEHPELCRPYWEKIVERLADTGVSVRKKAVKVLGDAFLDTSSSGITSITAADVCTQQQLVDVCTSLSVMLLDPNEEDTIKKLVLKSLSDFWFGADKLLTGDTRQHAQTIVKFCSSCHKAEITVMTLAKESVTNKTHGKTPAKRLVLAVMDLLVERAQARAPPTEMESLFKCLRVLCQADSELMDGQVGVLVPFLKDASTAIVSEVALIIALAPPMLDDKHVEQNLEESLESLLYTQPPAVLPQIVQAMHKLRDTTGRGTRLSKAFMAFSQCMEKFQSNPVMMDGTMKSNIQRSMWGASLIIRHCPETRYRQDGMQATQLIQLLIASLVHCTDATLRKRAMQSLALVLVREPRFAGDAVTAMCVALTDPAPDLRATALTSLQEILVASDSIKDNDIAVSLLTGVLQRHVMGCITSLSDGAAKVRCAAVLLMRLLVSHGLVHPNQCVVALVALEGDPATREIAHRCLEDIHSRHKILPGHLADGLARSATLMSTVGCMPDTFTEMYATFMQGDRVNRYRFLESAVSAAVACKTPNETMFICMVLADLGYRTFDEVAVVINRVRRVALLGATVMRGKLDVVFAAKVKALKDDTLVQDDTTKITPDLRDDIDKCRTHMALFALARHLTLTYKMTPSRLEAPIGQSEKSETKLVGMDGASMLLGGGKFVVEGWDDAGVSCDDDWLGMTKIYGRFTKAMKMDEGIPAGIIATGGMSLSSSASSRKRNGGGSAAPKRKRKRVVKQISSSDDEDEDELRDEEEEEEEEEENDDDDELWHGSKVKTNTTGVRKSTRRRVGKKLQHDDDDWEEEDGE